MTARDRWTEKLKCPTCGREGRAELSQLDGWSFSNGDQSTTVDEVTAGFGYRKDISGHPKFFCREHPDVEA